MIAAADGDRLIVVRQTDGDRNIVKVDGVDGE